MLPAGLIPERTADPGRAFHLWSSDGVVILSTGRTEADGTLAGARDIFGPRLFVCHWPDTGAVGTMADRPPGRGPLPRGVPGNAGVHGQLHIDGWLEFGDYYPDVVFALCEREASASGQWFAVDGQHLLAALAADSARRALSRFLWDVKLGHRSADGNGPVGIGPRAARCQPVASRTCGGRLTVRRDPHQRLLDDADPRSDDHHHLAAWMHVTEQVGRAAPRFVLHPGELLCIDNYRIFHGREPSTGSGEVTHRLWAWTDMAFGLPYPHTVWRGEDTLGQGACRS